jgi:hypothetical protein
MAQLTILTPKELQTVYALPQFTDEERDTYFSLDPREKQALDEFSTFTAKTKSIGQDVNGFILIHKRPEQDLFFPLHAKNRLQ